MPAFARLPPRKNVALAPVGATFSKKWCSHCSEKVPRFGNVVNTYEKSTKLGLGAQGPPPSGPQWPFWALMGPYGFLFIRYIYIYTFIHVYVYMYYIYTHTHIYIYIYIYISPKIAKSNNVQFDTKKRNAYHIAMSLNINQHSRLLIKQHVFKLFVFRS